MNEKFRNTVCNSNDLVDKAKKEIFELISLNKTICGNLPNLQIPNLDPRSAVNSGLNAANQASLEVINFLNDILATVLGINFDEMRSQLIDWLVNQLQPLALDLSISLPENIKSCFACKVNPVIPQWLFDEQTDIDGNVVEGIGINIKISDIDLFCLFGIDPNSDAGKFVYDGNKEQDINRFMWEVIQQNGNPLPWTDPDTQSPVLIFRYYENNPIAFTETNGNVDYQNTEQRDRVFNLRIPNSYKDKTIINFLVDYFNSQNPIFNPDKLIPNIIDLLYGTLTNKLDLPTECVQKTIEVEEAIKDYINNGIDNEEITFDDSFYTFTTEQRTNIKNLTKERQLGVSQFRNCCGKKITSISYETLKKVSEDIESASSLQERIQTYTRALDTLANESAEGVLDVDKDNAVADFFARLLIALQIVLSKLVLSPKFLLVVNLFIFLLDKQSILASSIKDFFRRIECLLRDLDLISELLRKLIYEFLLPLVIKALTQIILCVITKKLKEKNVNDLLTFTSLLPPFISDNLGKLNEALGNAGGVVDSLNGFTSNINLDGLNNINLQFGEKGRFC
jgi:hypothetical protein